MKKLIIALLALVAFVGANAQNANRGGFFIEAGIGGTTGTSPRTALFMDGTSMMAKFAGGAAFDVQFGFRTKTSNHWPSTSALALWLRSTPYRQPRYSN